MVFAILKCSAISKESNDALEVSQVLYKECFEYAEKTNQVIRLGNSIQSLKIQFSSFDLQLKRVTNFFLYQLGLLKHEDKSFHLLFDVDACRSALKHAIKQNSLPAEATNSFEVFFNNC